MHLDRAGARSRSRSGFARVASAATLTVVLWFTATGAAAERLLLVNDQDQSEAAVVKLQPFDVYLVAERDSLPDISAVAYTLELPDGVLVVGEQLLVDSLLGLGSSQAGMNLVFRCAQGPRLRVLRFRCVATKPIGDAVLRLVPDRRTQFLGLVTCRAEDFSKADSPPAQFTIHVR
jgi:hypothetical protein